MSGIYVPQIIYMVISPKTPILHKSTWKIRLSAMQLKAILLVLFDFYSCF